VKKVLIANRGEIAVRITRACRQMGLVPAAIYSDADRNALHVLQADEAYRIGPPPASESYLQAEKIIELAGKIGADAIHPGYGFLAENSAFARACTEAGIVFIGPNPKSMNLMGDKVLSRQAVAPHGVPIIPGTKEPVDDPAKLAEICSGIGFPVLLKASAGGGGKGMRRVDRPEDLLPAFERASSEASSYFGDGRVYVEKFLEKPRHIEVQVMADHHGNVIHLGERECSLQRRHQKIVEECPSPIVDPPMRERLGSLACSVARAAEYDSAGTVEFLVDASRNIYFLEMNTRIQVEHPITEMVTGVDLVQEQIRVAMGEHLSLRQEDVRMRGHAIECRVYAEDPFHNFAPCPGKILYLRLAEGPGIRNDCGVAEGYTVPLDYDPLLAKLIAHGSSRIEAIRRLLGALREHRVEGIDTNLPFFAHVISLPEFLEGSYDTGFVDRILSNLRMDSDPLFSRAALTLAAIHRFRQHREKILPEQPRSPWKSCSWRGR